MDRPTKLLSSALRPRERLARSFFLSGLAAVLGSVGIWPPARSVERQETAPMMSAATNAATGARQPAPLAIHVDGQLTEPAWNQAEVQRAFVCPWSPQAAPATEFRAIADGQRLYFAFEVSDSDVIVATNYADESTVAQEDRVELFLAQDAALVRYFCLEIDPLGRVHDYAASYYRKFDNGWNCPGLRAAGRMRPGGYTVEAAIPLQTLTDMMGRSVSPGATLRVGIFRAEFRQGALGTAADNWLSWIRPQTATPDFHVPSAFADWRVPGAARAAASSLIPTSP